MTESNAKLVGSGEGMLVWEVRCFFFFSNLLLLL